jgi:hypothetical protein
MRPAGPRLTQLIYAALHNLSKDYVAAQHLATDFADLPPVRLDLARRLNGASEIGGRTLANSDRACESVDAL